LLPVARWWGLGLALARRATRPPDAELDALRDGSRALKPSSICSARAAPRAPAQDEAEGASELLALAEAVGLVSRRAARPVRSRWLAP
jgi:hypothetical protein